MGIQINKDSNMSDTSVNKTYSLAHFFPTLFTL